MTILVTGGAGFIGSNFVLDWLSASDEPTINLDKLTYAGNLENLTSLQGDARWVGEILSAENKRQLWIPEGFAHGYVVLSQTAEFLYKTTDYWFPEHERRIRWDDPALAIDWKLQAAPALSGKDAQGKSFKDAEYFV